MYLSVIVFKICIFFREISRKRKEFEYRIQRRIKEKDDFVQFIAFELALLEDISLRRKQAKLTEKKKDIEFSITKRLNKVFKQFIFRYQNDVAIYFEYIKFCRSVGFDHAISAILGQMLQVCFYIYIICYYIVCFLYIGHLRLCTCGVSYLHISCNYIRKSFN